MDLLVNCGRLSTIAADIIYCVLNFKREAVVEYVHIYIDTSYITVRTKDCLYTVFRKQLHDNEELQQSITQQIAALGVVWPISARQTSNSPYAIFGNTARRKHGTKPNNE